MSAPPRILARLRAGGWRIGLGIKIEGDAPPPPDLLTELQAEREAVLRALVEETLAARLSAPAPDMVATILTTFPQSKVVGEAEPLEAAVRRWLDKGAAVEALGDGYRLTLPDGRSLTITAAGAATLDDGLRGDLAERVAIATEHLARPPSWASLDPPPQGAWCLVCRGGRGNGAMTTCPNPFRRAPDRAASTPDRVNGDPLAPPPLCPAPPKPGRPTAPARRR